MMIGNIDEHHVRATGRWLSKFTCITHQKIKPKRIRSLIISKSIYGISNNSLSSV